ncbi:DNA polymerase alpha, subunit B [Atractiella rhizophila]|nr:DNA polymerase alpha, subunit B [Atractiella rhizophila]
MSLQNDLVQHFGSSLSSDPTLMADCLNLLSLHELTPESLYFKWEELRLSKGSKLAFNGENFQLLKKEINRTVVGDKEKERARVRAIQTPVAGMKKRSAGLDGILGPLSTPRAKAPFPTSKSVDKTPLASRFNSSYASAPLAPETPLPRLPFKLPEGLDSPSSPSVKALPFKDRQNSLQVVDTLNSHLSIPENIGASTSRVKVVGSRDPAAYSYRYMFEKLTDKGNVLDQQIDNFAALYREIYPSVFDSEDGSLPFGDPTCQSSEDIWACGRICPESDEQKLGDEGSGIFLETSRLGGGGRRVELRFDGNCFVRGSVPGTDGFGLFPGMIVAMKGRNGTGTAFNVSEVLSLPPPELPDSTPQEVLDFGWGAENPSGGPMTYLISAGPFTVEENLDYEPLQALIDEATLLKPSVLLLIGPFLDSNHPLVRLGLLHETPHQLFKSQISSKLNSFMDSSPRSTVILVPSLRDMTSYHLAFPQSPFEKDPALGLKPRAKMLPNPFQFTVNELVFGLTSVDALFHLRNQEFFKRAQQPPEEAGGEDVKKEDLLSRTCRHLIRQRSFYPLFPAPKTKDGILPLDITHRNLLKFPSSEVADILILPSTLKYFTKVVDSTIVVNPSYLTKGNQPGTFARLTIWPMKKDELERRIAEGERKMQVDGAEEEEDEDTIPNRAWERVRVDIIKI